MSSQDVLQRFERLGIKSSVMPCVEDVTLAYPLQQEPSGGKAKGDDVAGVENPLQGKNIEDIESAMVYCASQKYNTDALGSPGQDFFMQHRKVLLNYARQRYHAKTGQAAESDTRNEEYLTDEAFGSFGDEFVHVPNKGHLWDYHMNTHVSKPRRLVEMYRGKMPTIEQVVEILQQEQMQNVQVVDFNAIKKRDHGLYCIIATGTTRAHCRRVGRLLYRTLVDLQVPFVSNTSYCFSRRSCEWITAKLGPLVVHLVTPQVRTHYNLEHFWDETHATSQDTTVDLLTPN